MPYACTAAFIVRFFTTCDMVCQRRFFLMSAAVMEMLFTDKFFCMRTFVNSCFLYIHAYIITHIQPSFSQIVQTAFYNPTKKMSFFKYITLWYCSCQLVFRKLADTTRFRTVSPNRKIQQYIPFGTIKSLEMTKAVFSHQIIFLTFY